MSVQYKMTITEELANRLAQYPGTPQEITIRALHLLAYGSPVEQELRAEIDRLHETIRRLGAAPALPSPPQPSSEKELSWSL